MPRIVPDRIDCGHAGIGDEVADGGTGLGIGLIEGGAGAGDGDAHLVAFVEDDAGPADVPGELGDLAGNGHLAHGSHVRISPASFQSAGRAPWQSHLCYG